MNKLFISQLRYHLYLAEFVMAVLCWQLINGGTCQLWS
jgi:hypothetical protein